MTKQYSAEEVEKAIAKLCDYDSNEVPPCVDVLEWAASRYREAVGVLTTIAETDDEDNEWDGRDRFHAVRQRARDFLGVKG